MLTRKAEKENNELAKNADASEVPKRSSRRA